MFTFMNRKKVQSQLANEDSLSGCVDIVWTSEGIAAFAKVIENDGLTVSEGSPVRLSKSPNSVSLVEHGFARCLGAQQYREYVCEQQHGDETQCINLGCCAFNGVCKAGEGICNDPVMMTSPIALAEMNSSRISNNDVCKQFRNGVFQVEFQRLTANQPTPIPDQVAEVFRSMARTATASRLQNEFCPLSVFSGCGFCNQPADTTVDPNFGGGGGTGPGPTGPSPTVTLSTTSTTAGPMGRRRRTSSPRRRYVAGSCVQNSYEIYMPGACGEKLHWFNLPGECSISQPSADSCYEAVLQKAECTKDFFTVNVRGNKNCACKLSNETSVVVYPEQLADCYRIVAPFTLAGQGIAGDLNQIKWLSPPSNAVPPYYVGVKECFDAVALDDECEQDYFTYNWHSDNGCGCKKSAESPLVVTASEFSQYFKIQREC